MIRHRVYRRTRVVLAFFLALLVVVSNPTTAGAATSGTLTFSMATGALSDNLPWSGTNCQLPWSVNTGGLVIGSSARCDGDPDTTPGSCQPYEGACGTYGLVLKDNGGRTCGSTGFEPYDIGGGIGSVKAGLGGGYVPISDCEVTEACLSYYYDPWIGGTTDWVTCVPFAVDQPENTDVDCDGYTVTRPKASPGYAVQQDQWTGYPAVDVRGSVSADGAADPSSWRFYWILRNLGGVSQTGDVINGTAVGSIVYYQHEVSLVPGTTAQLEKTTQLTPPVNWSDISGGAAGYKVIGVGVMRTNMADGGGSMGLPPNPDHSIRTGLSLPNRCSFYWGEKLVEFPETSADDPVGPVGTMEDPQAEDPPTTVEPVDETPEDEWSLWGAILAVLRAILGAFTGLINAIKGIASAILNGIKSLFVPERTLQSRVAEMDGLFQDRFPFNVADSLESMGLAPGGGGGIDARGTVAARGVPGEGGCPDWELKFPATEERGGHVFDTVCDSEFTSAIRGARPILLAGMLTLAFWPLIRGLFFASVPVIKPVPTDGK